jgi:hypothetical protein
MLMDVDAIAVSGFLRLVICHISSSRRRLLVRAPVWVDPGLSRPARVFVERELPCIRRQKKLLVL